MTGYIMADGRVRLSVFEGNRVSVINPSAVAPELCVLLGAAAGTVCDGRLGVGFSGGIVGETMKNAFVSGAQSAGVTVMDFGSVMESEAVFAISALGLGLSVYVMGGSVCSLKFLGGGGVGASVDTVRRIEDVINAGNFKRCCWNEYIRPADINGIKLLYRRELYSGAPNGLSPMCAVPQCEDPLGQELFSDTLKRLGCDTTKGNLYKLSSDGLSLSIEGPEVGIIGPRRVTVLSCGAEFERHNDVAVPRDAPDEIDILAGKYARRVYRMGADSGGDDSLARAQYRIRDGIITAVRLLSFMKEKDMTLEQLDMHFA